MTALLQLMYEQHLVARMENMITLNGQAMLLKFTVKLFSL